MTHVVRSNEKLEITIYSPRNPISETAFERLWSHFGSVPFSATRYDTTEPIRKYPHSGGAWREGYRLYRDLSVLIRGKAASAMIQQAGAFDPVAFWVLWVNNSALASEAARARWLGWLGEILSQLPVFFAFGCMESERREKHQVPREMPIGLLRAEELGWRPTEFVKSLPGVYWLNYYGKEITGQLGSAIRMNPNFSVQELEEGKLLAVLKEPPTPSDLMARIALERQIARDLGAEYFFDNRTVEIMGSIEGDLQVKLHAPRRQIPELLSAINRGATPDESA